LPEGVEGHLDATRYNPPNLTYPFGAYISWSTWTRHRQGRRPPFIAVDDCG
jgi:carbon-monoxide dehydrogenase large subunit